MTKFILTNKKFLGVEGYHHSEEVTIVDVIARDIVTGKDIEALEFAIECGFAFVVDHYEMRAA